jgi:hypothetical protein
MLYTPKALYSIAQGRAAHPGQPKPCSVLYAEGVVQRKLGSDQILYDPFRVGIVDCVEPRVRCATLGFGIQRLQRKQYPKVAWERIVP